MLEYYYGVADGDEKTEVRFWRRPHPGSGQLRARVLRSAAHPEGGDGSLLHARQSRRLATST